MTNVVRSLLLFGAGAYAFWIISVWLRPDLDPLISYVSELSAKDQTWSLLFRASDALAGTAIALAAVQVLARAGRQPRLGRVWLIGWGALAVFGIATVLDALTPMACAVTHDYWCAVQETAGELPLHHTLHSVTSSLANVGLIVAAVALTHVLALGRSLVGRVGWVLVAGIVIGTVWTLVEISGDYIALPWPVLLGVAQRLTLSAASLWLGWLALNVNE